ncbi:hypothetical protein EVA_06329 [gut metagenome]|uniref:Uncharacterized protein n=1 Tax=gut metagenome TaxID=749906 RepID=J9GF78_9ZZZZ
MASLPITAETDERFTFTKEGISFEYSTDNSQFIPIFAD